MSNRTLSQNNLYHSIIGDIAEQAVGKHLTNKSLDEFRDEFRDMMKKADENYPIDYVYNESNEVEDGKPISSAKLTTKQIRAHIEFIVKFVGQVAGITPKFVQEDWDRLMKSAH